LNDWDSCSIKACCPTTSSRTRRPSSCRASETRSRGPRTRQRWRS
jgi:hypothetical protein